MERRKHGTIKAKIPHIRTQRADRNAAVIKKWQVQGSDHGCRQRSVANANPLPVERQEYGRKKFHCYQRAQARRPLWPAIAAPTQRRTRPAVTRQQCLCDRFQPLQWPTAGSRRTPEPGAFPSCTSQDIEQDENNCELANHERYFQCKGGLLNRGHRAEKSCAPAGYGLGRSGLFKLRVSGV